MAKKLPSDILRYMVQKSFEEGPSYGYEVVSCIEKVTGGYWSPSYGTIYPLIQRLEDEGLLVAIDSQEAKERGLENNERKYFELTEDGEEEIPDVGDKDVRENFEELILGYLKIYKNTYGGEALNDLVENLGRE